MARPSSASNASRLATSTTLIPDAAICRANSLPIPDEAPVTSAHGPNCPLSSAAFIVLFLSVDCTCCSIVRSHSVPKALSTSSLFFSSSSRAILCFLQSLIIGAGSDSFSFSQSPPEFHQQPVKRSNRSSHGDRFALKTNQTLCALAFKQSLGPQVGNLNSMSDRPKSEFKSS